MARGITQDQVNRAADAIMAAGENPTVEKVRAELGTGSPNTVTRMLDTWRWPTRVAIATTEHPAGRARHGGAGDD